MKLEFTIKGSNSVQNTIGPASINIYINNVLQNRAYYDLTIWGIEMTGSDLYTLSAGTYTIQLRGANNCQSGCSSLTISGNNTNAISNMIVQIIPQ